MPTCWIIKAWSSWIQKEIKIHIRERKKKKKLKFIAFDFVLIWKMIHSDLNFTLLKKYANLSIFFLVFIFYAFLCVSLMCEFVSVHIQPNLPLYMENQDWLSHDEKIFLSFFSSQASYIVICTGKKEVKSLCVSVTKGSFSAFTFSHFFAIVNRVKEHVCGYKKVLPFYLFFLNENLIV